MLGAVILSLHLNLIATKRRARGIGHERNPWSRCTEVMAGGTDLQARGLGGQWPLFPSLVRHRIPAQSQVRRTF
jgi:hypothetical protein